MGRRAAEPDEPTDAAPFSPLLLFFLPLDMLLSFYRDEFPDTVNIEPQTICENHS
jgi:hypothetical protein